MKVILNNKKVREFFYNGTFYECNKEIDVPFSEAVKIARLMPVEMGHMPKAEYDASLWKENKEFFLTSDVDMTSGWGNASFNLLKYTSNSLKAGLVGRIAGVTDSKVLGASRREIKPSGAMVWHEQPKSNWITSPYGKNIAIVPFETTIIPESWIARINSFDALFVPCQQNKEAFEQSGVRVPIEIIHWGIDETKFKPIERSNSTFTFGTHGALSLRKGTDVLVQAFQKAFPNNENVKLICKTSYNGYPFMVKDKRVEVKMTPIDHDDLINEYFKKIDIGVYPTRGEGFGLCPLEVMATGAPVIVTGWSGPLEYMTPDTGWLIDYGMTPAKDFTETIYKENCGEWAEPSVDPLAQLMRYAYEHQDEVREKGKLAAKHVADNWLWSQKIKMFEQALDRYL